MITLYNVLGLIIIGLSAGLIWRCDALPCPTWLGWMVERDNPFIEVNRARVIVGLLELAPALKVLETSCGPGRLTISSRKKLGSEAK